MSGCATWRWCPHRRRPRWDRRRRLFRHHAGVRVHAPGPVGVEYPTATLDLRFRERVWRASLSASTRCVFDGRAARWCEVRQLRG